MTASPASPATTSPAADASVQADGALLTAMRLTAAGVSTEVCRQVLGPLLTRQHAALGGLLRAAAINGLDASAAAQVAAQIDAALAATKTSGTFQPPAIRAFRDEGGAVVFQCVLDLAALSLSINGMGYHASVGPADVPDRRVFSATVDGVPSSRPTFIVPAAPAPVVNVNPTPATRQTIQRDEDGEIRQIDTTVVQ